MPNPRRASAFARSVDDVANKKGTVPDFLASIKMGAFWPEFEKRGYTMFCDFMDSRDFSDEVLQEMGMSKVRIQFFRRLLRHGAVQIYLKANDASDGSVFSDSEVRAIYQEMLQSCAVDELDISQFKDFIKSLLKSSATGTMPSDQDLEQAFEVADADNSNAFDEDEALAIYKLACAGKVNGLSKANLFSTKKLDFKKSMKASVLSKQLKKNARQKSFRASKEVPIYESGSVPVSTPKCCDLTYSTLTVFIRLRAFTSPAAHYSTYRLVHCLSLCLIETISVLLHILCFHSYLIGIFGDDQNGCLLARI